MSARSDTESIPITELKNLLDEARRKHYFGFHYTREESSVIFYRISAQEQELASLGIRQRGRHLEFFLGGKLYNQKYSANSRPLSVEQFAAEISYLNRKHDARVTSHVLKNSLQNAAAQQRYNSQSKEQARVDAPKFS